MEWTKQKLADVCVELQKKAMVDEAFRKELLADSAKAIETLTGEKPPEGFRLKVIENDPAYTATMVLPNLLGRELTDEEFDAVSGGISFSDLFRKSKSLIGSPESKILGAAQGAWIGGMSPYLNRPAEETK